MNKTPFDMFTILLVVLILLGFIMAGADLAILVSTGDLYKKEFCFSNDCVDYFIKQTSTLYSFISNYLAFLTFIVTTGGIYIAIKTYINTTNTNALNWALFPLRVGR